MTPFSIARPAPTEHAPYYGKYIDLVPEGDLVAILGAQQRETARLLAGAEGHADFKYAADKWTVKEVVGHLSDAERVFTYRALRFARADSTNLPGFDENPYVEAAQFGRRTLADLADEYSAVRTATIHFARHVDAEASERGGSANNHEISVRALLYIAAGHELHHGAILRARYGL